MYAFGVRLKLGTRESSRNPQELPHLRLAMVDAFPELALSCDLVGLPVEGLGCQTTFDLQSVLPMGSGVGG